MTIPSYLLTPSFFACFLFLYLLRKILCFPIEILCHWHKHGSHRDSFIHSVTPTFELTVLGPSSDWILKTIKTVLAEEPRLNVKGSTSISFFTHYSFLPRHPLFYFRSRRNILFFTHLDSSKYQPESYYMSSLLLYDAIVCMNTASLKYIQGILSSFMPSFRPKVFLNLFAGVDSSIFYVEKPPFANVFDTIKDFFVVGFHCRPYPRKRPCLIADAIYRVPNCVLLCCGPGHDFLPEYRPLISENRVFFLDLPFHQISFFYSLIDILVCTSSIEGGPTPLVEANSLGIPFISTDVGFAADVATSHDTIVPVDISATELSSIIRNKLKTLTKKPPRVRMWEDNALELYEQLRASF